MHETAVSGVWIIPFAALLAAIALMPLVRPHWWEKNYPWIAFPIGLLVGAYYLFGLRDSHFVMHTMHEYFSFICLIGSLFIVAGGIHMSVKGEATPLENTIFLTVGSLLANVIGTTGASMVMIRPWIRMNRHRIATFHVIFFIFLVSNIGGALTPIGDPPLFLGYLKGVPFFWIGARVIWAWLFTMAVVLAVFFALDARNYRTAPPKDRALMEKQDAWRLEGVSNLIFLAVIVGAVFITKPLFLREAIMIAAAVLAYKTTPKGLHARNNFNFAPIREVAILFFGIFLSMMPALQWMESHASSLGISTARHFYFGSGFLSAVLDNAPTYLNFLSVGMGLYAEPAQITQIGLALSQGMNALRLLGPAAEEVTRTLALLQSLGIEPGSGAIEPDRLKTLYLVANKPELIKAISLGSVFFGAMTYIGNGPNFLVKSIAEHEKVRTASFIGYVAFYSAPVLLPTFVVVALLFL